MRQSKELTDVINDFLRDHPEIIYISIKDMYNIADMTLVERIKIGNIIALLKQRTVISFDNEFMLWKNNYSKNWKEYEKSNKKNYTDYRRCEGDNENNE